MSRSATPISTGTTSCTGPASRSTTGMWRRCRSRGEGCPTGRYPIEDRRRHSPVVSCCPPLELQQCIRIAVREFGHVVRGERDAVQEVTTSRVGGIGVVDREHDAGEPEGQRGREKRRLAEDPAGG